MTQGSRGARLACSALAHDFQMTNVSSGLALFDAFASTEKTLHARRPARVGGGRRSGEPRYGGLSWTGDGVRRAGELVAVPADLLTEFGIVDGVG